MACIAPSQVVSSTVASDFGRVAETIISALYLKDNKRPGFFPLPPGLDFMDIGTGFGNTVLYIAYLKANHSKLSPSQLAKLSSDGLLKIPDIASLQPPGGGEFYEIKPNSDSGKLAGMEKVAFVDALYTSCGLPYVPGTKWKPDKRITVFDGKLLGIEVKVFFHFFLLSPGLVVYEVCAEGKTRPLTSAELAAIIALVIIALIAIVLSDGAILIPAAVLI